jgi:hypothetical protein
MHGLRQQDPPGRDLASQRRQTGCWHKRSYHPKLSPFQMEELIWCYTNCKGEVGIGAAESLQSLPVHKDDSSAVSPAQTKVALKAFLCPGWYTTWDAVGRQQRGLILKRYGVTVLKPCPNQGCTQSFIVPRVIHYLRCGWPATARLDTKARRCDCIKALPNPRLY